MKGGGKTMIMVLGLLAALGFAYMSFFNNPSDEFDEISGDESAAVPDAGQEIIALLEKLRSIELDGSFFSSALYASLRDYRLDLIPVAVGRNNPFAPIGRDSMFVPSAISALSAAPAASLPTNPPTQSTTTASSGGSVPATSAETAVTR